MKINNICKIFPFLITGFILTSSISFADTIVFKSGRTIKADIIEKTDAKITLDLHGAVVSYYVDDVKSIEFDDSLYEYGLTGEQSLGTKTSLDVSQSQKNFLWKATSSNSTVYLLGSMHLAKQSIYPLGKQIEDAFEASDALVVEVDVSESNSPEAQMKLAQAGMYTPPDKLEDHLSPKTLGLTKKKLSQLGVDISQMNTLKPWFLAMNLTIMELFKLGFNPEIGIDNYFLGKLSSSKEILQLETIDYQINLFDNLTDKQQDAFLFSTLLDLEIIEKNTDLMISAWKSGDTQEMETFLTQNLSRYPEIESIYEALIYKRNYNMASKIEGYLKTGKTYFLVVGAAHLVGKRGIIQLLKDKGFNVAQM